MKSGSTGVTLIVAYPPPQGRAADAASTKAAQLSLEWLQHKVGECGSHATPIVSMDLSSGVGTWSEGGGIESESVGGFRLQL